jgi:hypothetical protein
MFLPDACLCVLEGAHMEVPSILYQISLMRVGNIFREKTKTFPCDNSSTLHALTVNPSGILQSL